MGLSVSQLSAVVVHAHPAATITWMVAFADEPLVPMVTVEGLSVALHVGVGVVETPAPLTPIEFVPPVWSAVTERVPA